MIGLLTKKRAYLLDAVGQHLVQGPLSRRRSKSAKLRNKAKSAGQAYPGLRLGYLAKILFINGKSGISRPMPTACWCGACDTGRFLRGEFRADCRFKTPVSALFWRPAGIASSLWGLSVFTQEVSVAASTGAWDLANPPGSAFRRFHPTSGLVETCWRCPGVPAPSGAGLQSVG